MGILIRIAGYGISCFGLYIFVQQLSYWFQSEVWLTLPLSLLLFGPNNQSVEKMVPFHFNLNIDYWQTLHSVADFIPLTLFWIVLGVVVSAQGVRLQEKFKF